MQTWPGYPLQAACQTARKKTRRTEAASPENLEETPDPSRPLPRTAARRFIAPACAFCIQSPVSAFTIPQKESALDNVATFGTGAPGHAHEQAHDHAHHERGFWQKYIFAGPQGQPIRMNVGCFVIARISATTISTLSVPMPVDTHDTRRPLYIPMVANSRLRF